MPWDSVGPEVILQKAGSVLAKTLKDASHLRTDEPEMTYMPKGMSFRGSLMPERTEDIALETVMMWLDAEDIV